jgi:hypothetical protein
MGFNAFRCDWKCMKINKNNENSNNNASCCRTQLCELSGVAETNEQYGRAIAQAVSRWLPTAAGRVRSRVWLSGICGGQSGPGMGFLRVLRFPLPIFIPPNSPSSQSPGAGKIGQSVAAVPSGPSWTPPPTERILIYTMRKTKISRADNFRIKYLFVYSILEHGMEL